MPRLFRLALALLCLQALPVAAQVPAKPLRLGLCAACHGENGRSAIKGTPHLAGQDLDYLKNALAAYRNGVRNVPLMRAAVGSVSEDDLNALAAWYAAQPPAP